MDKSLNFGIKMHVVVEKLQFVWIGIFLSQLLFIVVI